MSSRWDERFLSLAYTVSTWSRDPSTQVGSILSRPDNTVCSIGFNGFPRGMKDDEILYQVRSVKLQRVIHAEVNAVLNAREVVKGYTAYVTHPCCSHCAIFLIQAGIKRVVTPTPDDMFKSKWIDEWTRADEFFEEAGVERSYQ